MKQSSQVVATTPEAPVEVDWSRGWRYESVPTPEGKSELVRVPLTPEEILHPKEGYIMPVRTDHDRLCSDLCDMLRARYADEPTVAVFRDLVFEWDRPEIGTYAPDIAVTPGIGDRDANRNQFVVAEEGTRPCLIIEIVSANSREADRVRKVRDYARVGVTEYLYIDARQRKGETVWEMAGFRLEDGSYLPMLPDEDGAFFCETIGVRIGIEEGKVWLEDAETGEDLLTNLKAQEALRAEREARLAAESRLAELEAALRALRDGQR